MKLNKLLILMFFTTFVHAEELKIIPRSREETKIVLENLKHRKSRLPLPFNESGMVNNVLARKTYLPEGWYSVDFKSDPLMTLSYELKTQCFWVVSRANNCHYCLGHQEHKLNSVGFSDKEVAFLDYDWTKLDLKVIKAINLSKKITLMPHKITDEDIKSLKPEFNNEQIIELVYVISMFNGVNRWTDAMGLPQDIIMKEKSINFLTTTDNDYKNKTDSLCASSELPVRILPSLEETIEMINDAKNRECRVMLISENETKEIINKKDKVIIQDWERALAVFPEICRQQNSRLKSIEEDGSIDKRIKTIISWTSARHNNALFSLSESYKKLLELRMDPSLLDLNESEESVVIFTKKLTQDPQIITDNDINNLKEFYKDNEIAEIIYLVGFFNMIDRFTETLNCRVLN